jgi:hypothetical protein
MIKKIVTSIRLFALISLPLLLSHCNEPSVVEEKPEEPGLSYADRYGIFQEKDEEESSDFTLMVGKKEIKLYELANQNVKAGGIEVALNEFLHAIEGRIELYHRGVKKPFKMINLRKYSFETGDSRLWKPYPSIIGDRLGPEELKEIRQKVGIGSGIQMRLESEVDSASLYASLWVNNPFGGYIPPLKVRSNYFSQVYGFQLIQKDDRPVILRIDTTASSTKHVLDLYRNKSSYKVLHIPGFKTRRRMWREDLFSNKDIIKTQLLDNPYDLFFLPEYVNYEPRKIKLRWGKMESRFNSENYTLAFFRKNIQKGYQIWVGDTPLKVKNAHVIIKSFDTRPESIVTSDLNHPEVVKRLFRIGKNCSVYLDKIVVEDTDGKTFLFPESFAFHLEKSKEFELELAETRTIEEARLRVKRDGEELRIECTSMPLSELLAFLLEAPASNILLSGFNEEIYLDMLFASSSLNEKEGKELMLIKLQHYLKFVVEQVASNPVLALYVQDTTLLNKRESGEWEDRKVKFSENEGFKKLELHNIPMSELVELIAYDLSIPCVDLTETESNYSFSLQYEDKADLTMHLQGYGLGLDWYEENVQIMVSRY